MDLNRFLSIAWELEGAGLLWQPEVGDEVSQKVEPVQISILVDPHGMSPDQLRNTYLWLPTVEQLVLQLEARQAILFHAGLELSDSEFCYKTVIHSPWCQIEVTGDSLRSSLAESLRNLLLSDQDKLH